MNRLAIEKRIFRILWDEPCNMREVCRQLHNVSEVYFCTWWRRAKNQYAWCRQVCSPPLYVIVMRILNDLEKDKRIVVLRGRFWDVDKKGIIRLDRTEAFSLCGLTLEDIYECDLVQSSLRPYVKPITV